MNFKKGKKYRLLSVPEVQKIYKIIDRIPFGLNERMLRYFGTIVTVAYYTGTIVKLVEDGNRYNWHHTLFKELETNCNDLVFGKLKGDI